MPENDRILLTDDGIGHRVDVESGQKNPETDIKWRCLQASKKHTSGSIRLVSPENKCRACHRSQAIKPLTRHDETEDRLIITRGGHFDNEINGDFNYVQHD